MVCGQLVYTSNGVYSQGFPLYTHRWVYRENPHCRDIIRYISLTVPLILEVAMVQYFDLHVQLMLSLVRNYIVSKVSVTGKSFFFTSEIVSLTLNFSTIWLIECWLIMLLTQHRNRNWINSRVTLMLMMLHWHQHHIVNHALVWIMCIPLTAWICSLIGWYSWSTLAYTLVFKISTRLVVFLCGTDEIA